MHSPKNIKKGEKELYMTEGYDSLVLKIEWFFYVEVNLFWNSFIVNFYGESEGIISTCTTGVWEEHTYHAVDIS
jgi:hypothetical protein